MDSTIEVKLLLFARAAEIAGMRVTELALPAGSTVGHARSRLVDAFPELASLANISRWAVDAVFVPQDFELTNSPIELAMIPPVSGG